MLKKQFTKQYNPIYQFTALYEDADRNVQRGIVMCNVLSKKRGKPYVLIDSMVYKVPLANIIKIEQTDRKW